MPAGFVPDVLCLDTIFNGTTIVSVFDKRSSICFPMGALTTRWDTRLQIPSAIAMRDLAIGDIVKVIFHNITRSQCVRRN